MLKQAAQRVAEQQEREIRIDGATFATQLDCALLSEKESKFLEWKC